MLIPELPFDIYNTDGSVLDTITSVADLGTGEYAYTTANRTGYIETRRLRHHLLRRALVLGLDTEPWISRELTMYENSTIVLPTGQHFLTSVDFEEYTRLDGDKYLNELYTLDLCAVSKKVSGAFHNSYDFISFRDYLIDPTWGVARIVDTAKEYIKRIEHFVLTSEKTYN